MLAQVAGLGPDTGSNFRANLEGVIIPQITRGRPHRHPHRGEAKKSLPIPRLHSLRFCREGDGRGNKGVNRGRARRCEIRAPLPSGETPVSSDTEWPGLQNRLSGEINSQGSNQTARLKQKLPRCRKGLSYLTDSAFCVC